MDKVFGDLKVADFSWAVAGPIATKYLADHGATVIRVESNLRPCLLRDFGGKGVNRSGYFPLFNSNKYSVNLNLKNTKAKETAKRLVSWADVVVENYAPGTMEKWGFGYDALKSIKPDIIMLRSSNQGQQGPHANYSSTGVPLVGLSGYPNFLGWADRGPLPMPVAYTDWISPRLGTVALIAALDYRRRTGKGQCIDISQLESGIRFLEPAVLDYNVNGREGKLTGNADPYGAPHGVYRCKGDDKWCAIAVFSGEEWDNFCRAMSNPSWTESERFNNFEGRKANENELNILVETWTINLTPEEAVKFLQAESVAAGVVRSSEELLSDPHLKSREYFWVLDHKEMGETVHFGQAFKLSKTPAEAMMPSPCLGEHTEYVLTEILGVTDNELAELIEDGALV